MKRPKTFAAVMAAILFAPVMLALTFTYVRAQGCALASYVTVRSDVRALNVRAAPVSGTTLGTVPGGTTLRVINIDQKSCWYQVEKPEGWNVDSSAFWVTNSANYVTISTATPLASTETRIPTQTSTPVSSTPTRIITNTPLAPGYISTVSAQINREYCIVRAGDAIIDKSQCFLLPLDAYIVERIVQIQP